MTQDISALEAQIEQLKAQLAKLRLQAAREEVQDYTFQTTSGEVKLSELFGDRDDLWIVHNMGKSCPYCTLWADGLNGHVRHYEERANFVVCSPDPVDVQAEFAISRGWGFKMVSDRDRAFTSDMGFWTEQDGWWPGVSGFTRIDGKLYRTGKAVYGPGDDFCPIWPMMDLIGGDKGWEPTIVS